MKKNLKILIVILLIIALVPLNVFAETKSVKAKFYSDVGDHWAKTYIEKLTAMDILHGYPDGTCRPEGTITRSEFACLVSYTLKLSEEAAQKDSFTFDDVKNNWAIGHIELLVRNGVIDPNDYPEGFNANGFITRMEITKMMVNAIGKKDMAQRINSETSFLDDDDISKENKGYVIIAKSYNLIYGYPDNTFRADKNSTRAEAIALIARMLDVLNPPTRDPIHYPNAVVNFEVPEKTHVDKKVEFLTDRQNVRDLTWSLKKQNEDKNMENLDLGTLDGRLDEKGGSFLFKEKGNYELTATATNYGNSKFEFSKALMVYPVPRADFLLEEYSYTDNTINVLPAVSELGNLDIVWTISKDGQETDLNTCVEGVLTNEGGKIRFRDKGTYMLTATITDETGRAFVYDSTIKIYPIPIAEFTLPQAAHTDEMVSVSPNLTELGDNNVVWSVTKDGVETNWETAIEGNLTNTGGSIRFKEKGEYVVTATITDETGRSFAYSSSIKIFPLIKAEIMLPEFAHTDTSIDVNPVMTELGNLEVQWTLAKDGSTISLEDSTEGSLSNIGGTIRFKDKGNYTLTASITDEIGRIFVSSSNIKIYPVPEVIITLPEYAHTDIMVTVSTELVELDNLNIQWTAAKDNDTPVIYSDFIEGNLTNTGGNVRFKDKGNYLLVATVTDKAGRAFGYNSSINVNPIPALAIDLPERIHLGSAVNISTNPVDVGTSPVQWSLKKDGSNVDMNAFATANLSETGGTISFNSSGNYVLEARITDSFGRVFSFSDSIEAYNNAPAIPTANANVTRTISYGKFLVTLNVNSTDNDGDEVSYEYDGKAPDNYYTAGLHTVKVRAVDEYGAYSEWKDIVFTVVNNPPTAPVITRSPGTNSVSPGTLVTIDASSTDPECDAITYVWEGRTSRQATYPLGKNVIKVKAVDAAGAESPWAAIVFFVADEARGGGMTLTGPESTIIENGIEGATITEYTFTVPPVSGHSGSDYGRVRGYNKSTGAWEQIDLQHTNNGVTMTGNLPAGKYSKLELYYYTNHDCMYNKSNITYTVKYFFQ